MTRIVTGYIAPYVCGRVPAMLFAASLATSFPRVRLATRRPRRVQQRRGLAAHSLFGGLFGKPAQVWITGLSGSTAASAARAYNRPAQHPRPPGRALRGLLATSLELASTVGDGARLPVPTA